MKKALQLLSAYISIIILAKIQDKWVLIEFNYDCTRPNLQGQNDYAKEHSNTAAVAGFMGLFYVWCIKLQVYLH